MAPPPRAPAATSESEAKQSSSSVAARDLMVAYACSTASGSTSGTCSSTTYTSSRGSVLSSELGVQLQFIDDEEKAKRLERAKHLAKEFCHGDGDIATVERWLSEMGVGWVLNDDPSEVMTTLLRAKLQFDNETQRWFVRARVNLAERWIRALAEITDTNHLVRGTDVPGCVQLFRFVEATVRKMLPFVDTFLAAADVDASNGGQKPSEKLQALLGARDALSSASEGIQLYLDCNFSVEMEAHRHKLLILLSEKEHRLQEAIRNTMDEFRTGILNEDDDNEWGIQTPEGSSDICKVTQSLVTYIKCLWGDYWRLNRIVCAAAELGIYVPNRDIISRFLLREEQAKTNPLTTLALEMVSSLEVKLAKRSESFPDHSLRFVFLINNTHFIRQQLHPFFSKKYKDILCVKIEDYIQKYLQASWVPVMLCLYNHMRLWFIKNSTLSKFDLEFQKTYSVHKLWKVPDPELRTRLRKAIVKEVVPGLTRYLEDNNITSPGGLTRYSEDREDMLLELFEG